MKRIRFETFQKEFSSHAVMLITLTMNMFGRLITKMNCDVFQRDLKISEDFVFSFRNVVIEKLK